MDILKARLLIAKVDQDKKKTKSKASTATAGRSTASKENKKPAPEPDKPKKRKSITIAWSKSENHALTDNLLTLIEDSAMYKVAFGFNKGDVGSVPTGGKKTVEHYRAIARALFVDSPDNPWTEKDLPQLNNVVKNRINSLKSTYQKYRKEMSETGL